MRFRRRKRGSRGKREPLYWSRGCFDLNIALPVANVVTTCAAEVVNGTLVAFNPQVAELPSLQDERVTLLSHVLDQQITFTTNTVPTAAMGFVLTIVAVQGDSTRLSAAGTLLVNVLASEDILAIREENWIFSTGGVIAAQQSFPATPEGLTLGFKIRAKRKFHSASSEQLLIMYFLRQSNVGFATTALSTYNIGVRGVVSNLWQRTLR